MRILELKKILDFLTNAHRHISSRSGLYCLKLLRQPDGSRIPIEVMNGVRIKNFILYDNNTVIIEQSSEEVSQWRFTAQTYLSNLAMINVYDYSAEFLTTNSVDFVYLRQTKDAKIAMLAEWIHEKPGVLRAQWFGDEDAEEILANVGPTRYIKRAVSVGRNIDLEKDL